MHGKSVAVQVAEEKVRDIDARLEGGGKASGGKNAEKSWSPVICGEFQWD